MRFLILIGFVTLTLTGCFPFSRDLQPGEGPAHIKAGMTVQQAEDTCGWFLDAKDTLADGREARHYHFSKYSWWAGALRSPGHGTLYFRDGLLESWE